MLQRMIAESQLDRIGKEGFSVIYVLAGARKVA